MTTAKKANPVTEFLRGKKFQVEGYLFFPHLLAPKIEKDKAPKYGCMVAWDNHQNQQVLQQMHQLFMTVKQQFHAQIPVEHWVNPLKDFHTTKRTNGTAHPKYLTNRKWINASNNEKFPPQVMMLDASAPQGMRAASQMDAMQIYDGQKIVVSISFFGLNGENSKYGISTNIDAVLIAGGGERVMIDVGVDVGQAFGGFLGQMGLSGTPNQAPATYNPQDYQQAPAQQPPQQNNYQQQPPQQGNYYQQPAQQPPLQNNYQQPMTAHDPRTQQYNQNNGQQFATGPGYNNGNNGGNLV